MNLLNLHTFPTRYTHSRNLQKNVEMQQHFDDEEIYEFLFQTSAVLKKIN